MKFVAVEITDSCHDETEKGLTFCPKIKKTIINKIKKLCTNDHSSFYDLSYFSSESTSFGILGTIMNEIFLA